MSLSIEKQNKLKAIAEMRDPSLASNRLLMEALQETLSGIPLLKGDQGKQGIQGAPGSTPLKGVDYFTEAELHQIISYIQSRVKNGEQGLPGERGPAGKNGRDGVGTAGKDGRNGTNGTSPSVKEVVAELRKQPVNYEDIKNAPDLTDLPQLIAFLRAGGFRGGGSSSGTVAIVYTETPAGLINGSNKTYTVAHTITNVYSFAINGQFLHPTADYTFSGTTITLVTALDASLSGDPFTITYS